MSVQFYDVYDLLLEKFISNFLDEFSSNIPIYLKEETKPVSNNQYFMLTPLGSDVLEHTADMETRQYRFSLQFIYDDDSIDEKKLNHILRVVSRTEALVNGGRVVTLSDGSKAYDCQLGSCELDALEEEGYVAQWELDCTHSHLILTKGL